MGINWSTPTNIHSGPAMFAGMEVPELWTIQGSTKNKLMIGHLHKTDVIRDTIVVSLDCLQLQAGTSWQVLSCKGSLVRTYVNWCWASHMWEFNDCYNLTIHCEDKPWLLPQQEHDQFIMEALTDIAEAMKKQLRGTKCCQWYLQVMTLADISNSGGTHLAEWVTNPRYAQQSQHQASLKYLNQGQPNNTMWNDFVKILQLAFT